MLDKHRGADICLAKGLYYVTKDVEGPLAPTYLIYMQHTLTKPFNSRVPRYCYIIMHIYIHDSLVHNYTNKFVQV